MKTNKPAEISLIKYDWREIDRALLYYKVEDVNSAVKKILERIDAIDFMKISERQGKKDKFDLLVFKEVKEIIKSEMGEKLI